MKTSLDHLPQEKIDKLEKITSLIREIADPEMVILFGSHATGKWVNDTYVSKGIMYSYISDFDLLVVLKNGSRIKDYQLESMVEDKTKIKEPLNILVHDLEYINIALKRGRYFFYDIYNEGIVLFQTYPDLLSVPLKPNLAVTKETAVTDFDTWFKTGDGFLGGVNTFVQNGDYKLALFILHQAAERFYNALILVNSGYKTKTHNLYKLRKKAKKFSTQLFQLFDFSNSNNYDIHLFDLIKKGYIEARYDPTFEVNSKDFFLIFEKIKEMKNIVRSECMKKINSL